MNNDKTRGKIEKSKGKIIGDKSEEFKVKVELVKGKGLRRSKKG